jgi:hypothetical protein
MVARWMNENKGVERIKGLVGMDAKIVDRMDDTKK